MTIAEAQLEMPTRFAGGFYGQFVSGLLESHRCKRGARRCAPAGDLTGTTSRCYGQCSGRNGSQYLRRT